MEKPLKQGVKLAVEGHLATLTLNIPERHNALDASNIEEFLQHLDNVSTNQQIRVLVITGAGDKTFCAGAALNELGSGKFSGDAFSQIPAKIAALSISTICAFNGSAYGGGSEIGVACDFRIGSYSMRLFVPPARIGLCYPVEGIKRFVTTLGLPTAKRLLLASEEFSGTELMEIGYLTHLTGKDQLHRITQEMAERLMEYAPLAVQTMKQICNQVADGSYHIEHAQQLAEMCNQSEDLREGFAANKEKRKPVFKGI